MGISPAAILYDASGNAITIVNDGGQYLVAGVNKVLDSTGSQIDPATEETVVAIKDTDGIKKIVDALPAGSNLIGKIKSYLYDDVNEVALSVAQSTTIPTNTRGLLILGRATDGKSYIVRVTNEGRISVESTPPAPPAGTTEFVLAADDPLTVGPNPLFVETVSSVIPSGKLLRIQTIGAGAEGDPSERGSKVEVYWRVGATPVDHLVERIFLVGQTVFETLPNTGKSRNGTIFEGNGTNTYLVIRRERLSNSAQAIDSVVRGFLEDI